MRAGQSLDSFFSKHAIQLTSCSAIGIGNEDRAVMVTGLPDFLLHGRGDPFRVVVQARRKAFNFKMIPTVGLGQCRDFMRQGPARDNETH